MPPPSRQSDQVANRTKPSKSQSQPDHMRRRPAVDTPGNRQRQPPPRRLENQRSGQIKERQPGPRQTIQGVTVLYQMARSSVGNGLRCRARRMRYTSKPLTSIKPSAASITLDGIRTPPCQSNAFIKSSKRQIEDEYCIRISPSATDQGVKQCRQKKRLAISKKLSRRAQHSDCLKK